MRAKILDWLSFAISFYLGKTVFPTYCIGKNGVTVGILGLNEEQMIALEEWLNLFIDLTGDYSLINMEIEVKKGYSCT